MVFRAEPTFFVSVELRSVLSREAPRAVYEPSPALMVALVLEPALDEARSVRPSLELESDLFRPGVVGSSAPLRAVRPPSLEFEPDLVRAGLSAATSFVALSVEFRLVLEAAF